MSSAGGSATYSLTGGNGVDNLTGDGGNDNITGGDGADNLTGGGGNDTYIYSATSEAASGETINDSSGTADAISFAGSVDFSNMADSNFDNIEKLIFSGSNLTTTFKSSQLRGETIQLNETSSGTSNLIINANAGSTIDIANITATTFTSGQDTLTINGQNTTNETLTAPTTISATINGLSGNDSLIGSDQNDNLNGGVGDDNLRGKQGADTLTGGVGNDNFIFTIGDSSTTFSNADKILDFTSGQDKIKSGVAGNDLGEFSTSVGNTGDTFSTGLTAANNAFTASNTQSYFMTSFGDVGSNTVQGVLFLNLDNNSIADGVILLGLGNGNNMNTASTLCLATDIIA